MRKYASRNICSAGTFLQKFTVLPYGKYCFCKHNMFLLHCRNILFSLETILPVWQNLEHCRNMRALQMFLETCFLIFLQLPMPKFLNITNWLSSKSFLKSNIVSFYFLKKGITSRKQTKTNTLARVNKYHTSTHLLLQVRFLFL